MEEGHPDSFGQRFLRERKSHRWTQAELAERIGASVPSIDRWEHDRALPRKDILEHLIRAFGRPPERWGSNRWWNVPYPRNLYFTGREPLLQRLQEALVSERCGDSRAIRALSGMGGIGKTQTALEFAYRSADAFDAVLWVNAETRATLHADVAGLAQALDLPGRKHMHQFQAIEAVKEWLHNHDRWLLIFDTAENAAAIFSVVPRRYGGAILVTTRSQEADPHCKSIVMEVMSQSEGVTFLLRRTSDKEQAEHLPPPERAALSQLWATMGGLPLALDQAGAYIRIARCSFHEYLDLFRRHRKDLLAERGAQTPEHPNAVATTWNLSFQRLERETPAAAELLRLCAFLAPDAIPEQLIVWGNSMERSSFSARRCPRRR